MAWLNLLARLMGKSNHRLHFLRDFATYIGSSLCMNQPLYHCMAALQNHCSKPRARQSLKETRTTGWLFLGLHCGCHLFFLETQAAILEMAVRELVICGLQGRSLNPWCLTQTQPRSASQCFPDSYYISHSSNF